MAAGCGGDNRPASNLTHQPPAPSLHCEALPLSRGDAYTPRRIFIPPPKMLRRLIDLREALGGLRGLAVTIYAGSCISTLGNEPCPKVGE